MASDSTKTTLGIALGVCLVCSVLVSTAAVSLKPLQDSNKKLDKIQNILIAGDLLDENKDVIEIYNEKIEPAIVDLESGQFIPNDEWNAVINAEDFDVKNVIKYPEYTKIISAADDIAGIKKAPKSMIVYLVIENDEVQKFILPFYGKGLWSTMYGFIALDKNLVDVKGFTYYEHGETPGLGGEVDNPRWKSQWVGKKIFDDEWNLKIEVIKGKVDLKRDDAIYKVDGLSGSTLTTRGVDNTLKYWLGDNGYGQFFKNLREEGSNE